MNVSITPLCVSITASILQDRIIVPAIKAMHLMAMIDLHALVS